MDVNAEARQDVLLVEEEDNGKIKVVSGLDEDGKLKTVAPKQENESDFLKLDKNSNVLESFMNNYFRQEKNPKHTGFYRVAKEGIENVVQVISGLLQSGEEGKDFLDEYKVDTSKYQQEKTEQSQSQTEQQDQPKEQEKREYQPLDVNRIDWDMFEKIGVSRENLEKSNSLDDMLNYLRSSNLLPITMTIDDVTLNTDARLSLRKVEDGRIIPVIHAVRKEPQLDRPFYGNTFTPQDKDNLRNTGNLGRTIELNIKGLDKKIPAFVSVDPKTNELVAYSTKNIRIPNEIKGVTLDEKQKAQLLEGKGVYIEGMTSKTGKKFNATIQVSASERGITFKFDDLPKQQQSETQQQEGVRVPNKIGGVQIPDNDREALKQGGVIHVEGLIDKKGQKYNAYIQVNNEKGKLDFFKWDPRKKQGVTPDNNSTTQVAVNSEGKTNEATKDIKEPMNNNQIDQNEGQKQEQKSRGIKR